MLNNLQQSEQHDYSDNIFIGIVVFNDDPLGLKRVKCSIVGLFEETDNANLPWIAPMFFGPVATLPGSHGSFNLVPTLGSELLIEFQMGSPLHGLYVGSPMRPTSAPGEFKDADLKYTYGWKDPAGNIFWVNTKAGSNTIRIFHASGAEFKIINSGDTTFNTPGRLDVHSDGEMTFDSGTHIKITAPRIDWNP